MAITMDLLQCVGSSAQPSRGVCTKKKTGPGEGACEECAESGVLFRVFRLAGVAGREPLTVM